MLRLSDADPVDLDGAQFLTYEPWPGGLNNTRMCFETALVLAFVSNRVLVTPSRYRSAYEPEWAGEVWRPLHPREYLDWTWVQSMVSVLSYDEFTRLPVNCRIGLRAELVFSPGTTVLCYPSIPPAKSLNGRRLREFAAGRSTFLQLTPTMQRSRVLHIRNATLEHYYSFVFFCNGKDEIHCKRLVRDRVRFKREIVNIGAHIAADLRPYYAAHIRRRDFAREYPEQNLPAHRILHNISAHVPEGARLYVSTDEPDESFLSVFRERYEVYSLRDFADRIPPGIPSDCVGAVEQMVCAFACWFMGTRLSTFSAYITRLRGYYGAPDQGIYFTDTAGRIDTDGEGARPHSWADWVRTGNPLWGREFKEAWDFNCP